MEENATWNKQRRIGGDKQIGEEAPRGEEGGDGNGRWGKLNLKEKMVSIKRRPHPSLQSLVIPREILVMSAWAGNAGNIALLSGGTVGIKPMIYA